MDPEQSLRNELSLLERRWNRLTTVPETPRSLLQVLNYSLSSQGQGEVFMTRVLRYFLHPTEPHGVGDEFLRAFLEGLKSHQDDRAPDNESRTFDEDTFDLSEVEVDRQVQLGIARDGSDTDIESTGPVDLIIVAPGDWFLIIELKFGATENNLQGEGDSQTESYYNATHVKGQPKVAYESNGYYLYLHKEGKARAQDKHFTNWTWEAFAEDVLAEFIVENSARYPHRTAVQLQEMYDDIQELTGMTQRQQNEEAKTELYLEHYDAIRDVTEAFEARWATFTEEWAIRLAETLSEAGHGDVVELADGGVGFDLARSDGSERWIFRVKDSDWAHVMKDGWWRRTDDLSTIHERPTDRNDTRIGFYHRLGANRDLVLGEKTLEFTFRNMGANDNEFIKAFNQNLQKKEEDIIRNLPNAAELASVTETRRDLITATVDIRPEEHENIFTAYIAALQETFEKLVIGNGELIRTIDEIYKASLDHYR